MSDSIQPICKIEAGRILTELAKSNVPIKLNIGCGDSKLEGYINIDINEDNNPDIALDIRRGIPLPDGSVSEILFFHTIEHIEEKHHFSLLLEFRRLLREDGFMLISYPEFKKCAQHYINNYLGDRVYWKHTIYGLQRASGDYHVSLMDTDVFIDLLHEAGFIDVEYQPENGADYNTVIKACKGEALLEYEDILREEVFGG